MKIVALCGSLRKDSYNRSALEAAKEFVPKGVDYELVEIGELPFFNQDLENDPPKSVTRFKEKISQAEGILFGVAEYNNSVSAVLKNAIEWGSRPYGKGVLAGKPIAMMGASNGMIGTARAQYQLRQICVQVGMYALLKPEVFIAFAQEKFDGSGVLTDKHTREKIAELVEALVKWVGVWGRIGL